MNQLWRADITYTRLREQFVCLEMILDAFSRRVIGWALERRRNLEDELALTALRMALSRIQPGLVHHSDRRCQRRRRLHQRVAAKPGRHQHER